MTRKKKLGGILVAIALAAILLPGGFFLWQTWFVFDGDDMAWDVGLLADSPNDFVRMDNLLQNSVSAMEERDLTTGPVSPYLAHFGSMDECYQTVVDLQAEVHTWAEAYPDSAAANSEEVLARQDEVAALRTRFNKLPDSPIYNYYFYNRYAWMGVVMLGAMYFLILGLIWYNRPEEASHVC